MSPVMNEAALLRLLRGLKKVRGPDFHQPAMRSSTPSMENGGGLEKRHPLSKQERAEAEKLLSAGGITRLTEEQAEEVASKAIAVAADDGSATLSSEPGSAERAPGDERERAKLDVIDPANFFKEFDAWVDSKYPGDRGSATKVKVAFRKQHRATVNSLCLEDIEDIAQAMQ